MLSYQPVDRGEAFGEQIIAIALRVLVQGEACVALVGASKAKAIAQNILERYKRSRCAARILVREVT